MTVHDRISALVGKPLFWLLFVGTLLTLHLVRTILSPNLPPLPKALGVVEPFRLIDQRGRPFGTPDLTGIVWIAGLTCTRCPNVDPVATKHLAEIQHRSRNLGAHFHLIAITTEPEVDTPAILAEHAKQSHASAKRWSFLTGDRAAVKKLVDSLFAADPHQSHDAPEAEVIGPGANHRLVLVDQATQIRGYYDGRVPEEIDRALKDAGLLSNLRWRGAPSAEEPVATSSTTGQ